MTPSGVIVTISPGAISRTKAAPTRSSAGDSEATIHPSGTSTVPRRPRHSGRRPKGSRTAWTTPASSTTRENAPVTRPSTAPSALGRSTPPSTSRLSSSAMRSESDVIDVTVRPAAAASSVVLVMLPLWARANPDAPAER